MGNADSRVFLYFSLFLLLLVLLLLLLYFLYERRRKKRIQEDFRTFYRNYPPSQKEMRGAKRIFIPENMQIQVKFKHPVTGIPLQGIIHNISLSGMALKPGFSPRKVSVGQSFHRLEIKTPISTYRIKQARYIRFEQTLNKRLLALKILEIGDRQFKAHQKLLNCLEDFIQNEIK